MNKRIFNKTTFWIGVIAIITCVTVCILLPIAMFSIKTPSMPAFITRNLQTQNSTHIEITHWDSDFLEIRWFNNGKESLTITNTYELYIQTKDGWKSVFNRFHADFNTTDYINYDLPANEKVNVKYDLRDFTLEENGIYLIDLSFYNKDKTAYKNSMEFLIVNDYSDVYARKDINEAKRIVERHFNKQFDDCTLTLLWYEEGYSAPRAADWAIQYKADEAIVLLSNFNTGNNPASGLNPNDTYNEWSWVLVRDKGGKWELKTWGYG